MTVSARLAETKPKIWNKTYLGFLMFACAAANLAIGTLNGEQET